MRATSTHGLNNAGFGDVDNAQPQQSVLSVVIPAFNEEKTIETVVKKLLENNEIIPLVVNDGSNDKTGEIAKEAGALVLTHEKNKGKGEAIKTGFNYILKQNNNSPVVIIDADLQYSPE